ncbi:MAG: ion transporter [Alphaproteobacteria bacterium]|nr:ion transporter [Alphaproteobacteria bacterium]
MRIQIDNVREKLQKILESRSMHWVIGVITMINVAVLAIDTTPSLRASLSEFLEFVHLSVLWFFAFELALRIFAFGWKYFTVGWNIFDFIIVLASFAPLNEGISAVRALRIYPSYMIFRAFSHKLCQV